MFYETHSSVDTTVEAIRAWGVPVLLAIAWIAWWLWGANWKNVWPTLAQGGWIPAVLVILVTALVWSQIKPADCGCLQFVIIPNFWWQLGDVCLLAGIALFCGWLQGYFGWTPAPVEFGPPAEGHGDHGHAEHAHPAHDDHGPASEAHGSAGHGHH